MKLIARQSLLLITSLGAGIAAWFIPEGLTFVSHFFGIQLQVSDTLTRLFSASFGVLFAYMAGLVPWVKRELLDSQEKLYFDLKAKLGMPHAFDPNVSAALARLFSGSDSISATLHSDFAPLFEKLILTDELTRQAIRPVVGRLVGAVAQSLEQLFSGGLMNNFSVVVLQSM